MFKRSTFLILIINLALFASKNTNKILNDIRILEKQGKYEEIDSLFSTLNSIDELTSNNLIKWAEAKFITGKEADAGRIYCRADGGKLRFLSRNSFLTNLKNASDESKGQIALKAYFDCKNEKSDSSKYDQWAINTASQLNYYSLELNFITSLYNGKPEFVNELLSSSIKRITKGYPKESLITALKAWNLTNKDEIKNISASIIFKSYLMLNEKDSAFFWMKKSKLNKTTEISEAVLLCHDIGNTIIADSLITLLPQGINRDTLQLRNAIFNNQIKNSKLLLNGLKKKYNNSYFNILLSWKSKIHLYIGETEEFVKLINSKEANKIPFNSKIRTQFLKWNTASKLLQNDPNSLKIYGKISLLNYTGNYKPFNPFNKTNTLDIASKEFLLIEYLKGIIKNEAYSIGQVIITEIPNDCKNEELLYYKGIINIHNNNIDVGKKLLENLILTGKGSLFSQKARIYLLEMF